jgi:hypothetical protein
MYTDEPRVRPNTHDVLSSASASAIAVIVAYDEGDCRCREGIIAAAESIVVPADAFAKAADAFARSADGFIIHPAGVFTISLPIRNYSGIPRQLSTAVYT